MNIPQPPTTLHPSVSILKCPWSTQFRCFIPIFAYFHLYYPFQDFPIYWILYFSWSSSKSKIFDPMIQPKSIYNIPDVTFCKNLKLILSFYKCLLKYKGSVFKRTVNLLSSDPLWFMFSCKSHSCRNPQLKESVFKVINMDI